MKIRLDELVVKNNLAKDIKEARAVIMSGKILVDNVVEDKIGTRFKENVQIRIKSKKLPYVSRGGLKLETAFEEFDIDVKNKKCMDVGASTGGFTHLLLTKGAKSVYAVDVGFGILDWKIRENARVVVMEKTNIRNVYPTDDLKELDFICVDVSFISLKTIMKNLYELLKSKGQVVLLIKPQFEAKREQVGEGGIVTDSMVHKEVIFEVDKCARGLGFVQKGITKAKISGAKGNIEFLAFYEKD